LSLRLATAAGFQVAATGGSLFSNTLLGLPDAGFLTLAETEFLVSRMAASSDTPLIVDVDTGYGNAMNVVHTTRTLEAAGAAAIIIEDQVAPKRSGYMAGKQLISTGEMCGKLQAAVEARRHDDFLIVARSDAHGVEGIDGALTRAGAYAAAGAECLFIEGLLSLDDLRRIGGEVDARWKMTNLSYLRMEDTPAAPIPDLHTKPRLTANEMSNLGFAIAHTGTQPMRIASLALLEYYEHLIRDPIGAVVSVADRMRGTVLEDWHALTGYAELERLEERYLPNEESLRRHSTSQPGYFARSD
jgi:2-methylisocitrate lyase-like PEP mutase family enzyme